MTNGFFSVMDTPRRGAASGSILDTAEEESGLSAVVGNGAQTLAREQAAGDTAVLQSVRDVLSAAFRERPQFLDPFAPAAERNAEVLMVLRAAIQEQRQRGGRLNSRHGRGRGRPIGSRRHWSTDPGARAGRGRHRRPASRA